VSLTLSFHTDLWRVSVTGADWSAERVHIERSTNGLVWETVRGGRRRPVEGGAWSIDDYEYAPGVENTYRVTDVDDAAEQEQAAITPAHTQTVLKHTEYPALNCAITVQNWSPISRGGRSSVHEVGGRLLPIATGGMMRSREFALTLITGDVRDPEHDGLAEAARIDVMLAQGGVLLLQPPHGSQAPAGYVVAESVTWSRTVPHGVTPQRFELDCREVSAPDADVQTALLTWHTLAAAYGSWEQVWAAHPSWLDLWQTVVDPSEVVPI